MRTTSFSPYRTPLVSVPFRDNAEKLKKSSSPITLKPSPDPNHDPDPSPDHVHSSPDTVVSAVSPYKALHG